MTTAIDMPLKQKLFYFCPVLFCFCLPFGSRVTSVIIVVWTVASFLNLNFTRLKKGIKHRDFLTLVFFFLLTVLSAVLSDNTQEALFSIEVKLTFLIFPFLFFCFEWPVQILKRCVVAFVSGCFFASVYLIGRAFFYSFNGHPEYFFYTLFSDLMHASYFAMYLILAIVIVVLFYAKWFSQQKTVVYSSYFFIGIFVITIFLCSSKLGIISFFITMPLLLVHKWRALMNVKRVIFLLLSGFLVLAVFYGLFPGSFSRLNSLTSVPASIDKTSSESTTVRVLIWQESIALIRENFLFGTGVADVNDELYKAYDAHGLTGALSHKLNAHNQYFQTFLGMGIIGFTVLLLLTVGQLFKGILKKHFLLFVFSLLIALNFLVESMLQTAAGVLFFAFFYCLFNLVDENDLLSE